MLMPRLVSSILALGWIWAFNSQAATLVKEGTFGGMHVNYKVLLPDSYDAARSYPVILAFGGGEQSMPLVDIGLNRYWGGEARHRGYVVVSPAAPPAGLLFEGGSKIFPEFLEMILRDYKPQDGKIHAAGYSNGGITAFYVASTYPEYFRSVTGLPGVLKDAAADKVDALQSMCIDMYVGGNDFDWRDNMRQQFTMFQRKGYAANFRVEENQGHVLTLSQEEMQRLFDHLDAAAKGCAKQEGEKR
jgi:pimeloyl-ACP methyl ester carboxylesterase